MKWFIRIWAGLVILLNLLGITGVFIGAPNVGSALVQIREWYSPFNLWTWALNLALLSPALVATRQQRRVRDAAGFQRVCSGSDSEV